MAEGDLLEDEEIKKQRKQEYQRNWMRESSQKKRFNETGDSQLPLLISDGPLDTIMG